MSARVVPVGYILTDDALRELVTGDPGWQRLNSEWERATGATKAKARHAAKTQQDQINSRLFAAVKSHELPAIALKRTEAGDWVEHQVPGDLLEEMNMSVWTGSVDGVGLNVGDRWIAEAPLCFRRIEFERWRRKPEAPPAEEQGKQFIAFAQAAHQVHRALCGDETITGLASRERWLVTLDFLDASERGVTDEWQDAVNKNELFEHQCDEARSWIESRGLTSSAGAGDDSMLDRVAFEKAFAAAFPPRADHALPVAHAVKSGPTQPSAHGSVFLSDGEIIALARPVIDRIAADGRQLKRLDFEPLLRELTGDRLPPKVGDRLWPELARPEWRKGGKRPDGRLVLDWRAYLKSHR